MTEEEREQRAEDRVERRGALRRRARWIAVIFMLSTTAFFGAAGYAVYNGVAERDKAEERDQAICGAVNGLRQDFVDVIEDQKERGLKNTKKLGLDVKEAEEAYDEMLSKIGDEECP